MPEPSATPIPRLALTAEEAAETIGIAVRTWWAWDRQGRVPEPDLRWGKVVRWRVATIDQWLAAGAPDRETWATLKQADRLGRRRVG